MPYVKEDTDVTIVVAIENITYISVITQFLQRHAKLCSANLADTRQTRLVIAARGIDAAAAHKISSDLTELKRRFFIILFYLFLDANLGILKRICFF